MFSCKKCGTHTRQRAHFAIEQSIIRRFYQCRNLYCGFCFTTVETFQLSSGLAAENAPESNIQAQ
ncbi:ogr/Delta-like zinc finger family protein [Xenorhabdus stockiae]|uniref:ogr/Delta-like zinc finger family protein n=1 Tax=Xenorhabdus stockiae TaxID=351614 RepID=UPI003CEF3759